MRLIDSHCHLHDARFDADREAVLERARAAGVEACITIGTGPGDWERALALAAASPAVGCALGLHPHEADAPLDGLEPLLGHAVAVGEIGLDYHYDHAPRPRQRQVLTAQLELARRAGLPVVIHEREAAADVLAILAEFAPVSGVWHCFSGDPDLMERVVELGLHLGFGGLVTFARGTEAIQEAARRCPPERLLLETDAPYLAPVPHRGRRNEPAFVAATAARVGALRGQDAVEVAGTAARNARRLFGLGEPG